jgi:TusA-related sulfurtransferase
MSAGQETDYFLDISDEVCPMTFVKTKLLLERVPPGGTVKVRLRGREPLENVPRSVQDSGHTVLACTPEAGQPDGTYLLVVERR